MLIHRRCLARRSGLSHAWSAHHPDPWRNLDLAGLRLVEAVAELRWPMMRLVDGSGPDHGLFQIPSPNAIVLLAGDETPESEVREAFEEALPLLRKQQRTHGGRPRRSAILREDLRLQRAVFFLWLNSTSCFAKPLGREKIGRVWFALTTDWAALPAHKGLETREPVPHSLHQIPEAWHAWVEWRLTNSPIEDLGKDAVRAILNQLAVVAPVPKFEDELRRILASDRGGSSQET